MNTISVTEKLLEALRMEEDVEGYEWVESSDWEDQGKYQYQSVYVKKDGKFYSFTVQRSGSYFSDYHYDFPELSLTEVEKKEVTITKEVWAVV